MLPSLEFLAPSLHPNTLVDIAIPDPGQSSHQPIVRHLPIRHGSHEAVGVIKRAVRDAQGNIVVADDAYRISTIELGEQVVGQPRTPSVTAQYKADHRPGDTWSGLIQTQAGVITALTSGRLTLHSSSTFSTKALTRSVPSPLLATSSASSSATTFALAGKEVDVSVWDVERTFSQSRPSQSSGKRKKNELEPGEIWRAKNMPNTSLALRPPNHHLCLAHLTLAGPEHLVSGTKSGTIRRYDTRQRKPVNEWKVARAGGVGAIAQGQNEHQTFFADRANLLGEVDLRTGRLLYSYPAQTCTTHHILPLAPRPSHDNRSAPLLGIATVSSDATLRVHSTLPTKKEGEKGNVGGGRKAKVESAVGGVGIANAISLGWGEVDERALEDGPRTKAGADGVKGGSDHGAESEEEEVWEGMSEVGDGSEVEDSDEEDEVVPAKVTRR